MNYEEYLRSQNKPHDVRAACPRVGCGRRGPASTFALSKKDTLWICGSCFHEENRTPEPDQDAWDKERGNDIRAQRNDLLNRYAWTVTPVLNSALSAANILAWVSYINALNDLTIAYEKPSQVVWPTPPTLVYK